MRPANIKDKNIFITGGTGFIGSWLMGLLLEDNKIWCYDNCRRVSPKVKRLLKHRNLTFIKGDILDRERLKKSVPANVDIVMHLAAIAGVSSYYKWPFETMSTNLIGAYNLLEIFKERDIGILIDFSTSEVYGKDAREVRESDGTAQGPISDLRWTYAISKLAAEELCHCYHHKYGLPVVSIRPFNIYGPLQIGEGAIQIFVSDALKNRTLHIDGDGTQVRAWCYIEDFLEGVLSCVKNKKAAVGNVFNLGNPFGAISILGLARKVVDISGSKSKIVFKKRPRTDIEYRVPDISKAQDVLDFKPSVGLEEGLEKTIRWYREGSV